ncbi:transglycosylase domain-containing protein [Streptomyces sp. NPDC086023]|uniref:transglycosylase domain-containing protein n=1 Tax=Streptomyces sp. NPDC086023 TaxID=3365746 RepID=UPI0037CEEED2
MKNTYLSQDQTAERKVRELFLAVKVSNRMPKAEILEGYLNTSWFGRGAYGVQAAAYAYYGIPAARLDPGQAALLAAVLKGAEGYDPSLSAANHARAVDRWEWILDRQVETGRMSKAERAKYTVFPEPKTPAKPTSQAGQIGYLVDVANKYLKSRTGLTPAVLGRQDRAERPHEVGLVHRHDAGAEHLDRHVPHEARRHAAAAHAGRRRPRLRARERPAAADLEGVRRLLLTSGGPGPGVRRGRRRSGRTGTSRPRRT